VKQLSRKTGYVVLGAILVIGTATLLAISPANDDGADAIIVRSASAAEVVVYKSPTCGCCEGWAKHMQEAGFSVRVNDRTDLVQIKQRVGVPPRLYSCHTAVIGGKVVEGHVPASAVRQYLDAGAPGDGLGTPGMPPGSPGMPSLNPKPYDVFAFDGMAVEVFQHIS